MLGTLHIDAGTAFSPAIFKTAVLVRLPPAPLIGPCPAAQVAANTVLAIFASARLKRELARRGAA
eukprot:CAMPEP_0168392068 /NCGR_PEP_ID=MMETSP0228-20121227/18309_1 /TAXON_ID=133427 /ORGANISM="Protoceratium reticulatum, Strain CCCM 535 (=CCMP 1889)" /LENGTH=64 /DNA_ID=CAMNT_0008405401 /DNA_START=120 /DNA_END=310 /DNA_ORIENTATION=+